MSDALSVTSMSPFATVLPQICTTSVVSSTSMSLATWALKMYTWAVSSALTSRPTVDSESMKSVSAFLARTLPAMSVLPASKYAFVFTSTLPATVESISVHDPSCGTVTLS